MNKRYEIFRRCGESSVGGEFKVDKVIVETPREIEMPFDPTEQEIVDALNVFGPVAQDNNYTTCDWTNGVKAIFGAIGYREGYKIFSAIDDSKLKKCRLFDQIRKDVQQMLNGLYVPIKWENKNQGRNQFLGEWLYDILWWHENNQGYATDIPLVAESEWGGKFSDLQSDFPKLLLARSKYKFMIFEGRPNDISQQIDWCKRQITTFAYTQSGDRYLFCALQWGENPTFHFKLYVVP